MNLKTFRGTTMAEVLGQVKRQFGPDAVILNTRSFKKSGLLAMGKRPYVEITAARKMSDLPAPLRGGTLPVYSGRDRRADGADTPMSLSCKPDAAQLPDTLLSEVGQLRSLVNDLLRETRRASAGNLSGELHETYHRLVQNAVSGEIAKRLVEDLRRDLTGRQLRDPEVVRTHLARAMESMLPTSGPIRPVDTPGPTIIALIGPTGVGKTTTIAKLAANLCLRENRRVGLITIDTYRIAAVEQLKTYAQIIDVPLEVVMSTTDLKDTVARMADRDVILIDTAGRSQRDECKINDLKKFFSAVRPDEVHLVLSSTCCRSVLLETIQRFSKVGVNRLIFTKLDETIGFGVILGCLQKAQAQLSYVTTGQDVPDDIQVGEGGALARLILGKRSSQNEPAPVAV